MKSPRRTPVVPKESWRRAQVGPSAANQKSDSTWNDVADGGHRSRQRVVRRDAHTRRSVRGAQRERKKNEAGNIAESPRRAPIIPKESRRHARVHASIAKIPKE